MPTKLEQMDLTELAHQCEKVAKDPKAVKVKAMALYKEWTALLPASVATKPQDEKDAEKASLKARMIEFLTAAL
jgi:hypothetical protein